MIHRLVKFIISTAIGARTYDLSDFCRTFKIWRSKCKKHLFLCSFARWTRICCQKIHISCISVKIIVFMKATARIFFSHFGKELVLAPWLTTSKPCNFWLLRVIPTLLYSKWPNQCVEHEYRIKIYVGCFLINLHWFYFNCILQVENPDFFRHFPSQLLLNASKHGFHYTFEQASSRGASSTTRTYILLTLVESYRWSYLSGIN